MTPPSDSAPMRSYGCTFGCGNPYDFVIVSVADGTTELVCVPCFVRMATDMIAAVTEQMTPEVKEAMALIGGIQAGQVPGPSGNRGRRNAPATTTDPDVVEAYDSVIEDGQSEDM